MNVIPFPTLSRVAPESLTFELKSNTRTFGASPFSGEIQTIEMPGAHWQGSFDWTELMEADAAKWQSFVVKLRGQGGRFTMHNLARPEIRATPALANPSVNPVITAIGSSVVLGCTGWQPNKPVLLEGDFVGINGELKMIVQDAYSDGTGYAAFAIEPPMRLMPTPGVTTVVLSKPTATFMVTEDKVGWTTRSPLLTDSSFQFVEAFN